MVAQTNVHVEDFHDHYKSEIGIANAPVYLVNEKKLTYGLHFHYIRNIGESKYGIGFGYERLFDDHKHNNFGIAGSYRPIDPLAINIAPGIVFSGSDFNSIKFATHLETSYEFNLSHFHIGPVFELAIDAEDLHLSLGLHLGYGF